MLKKFPDPVLDKQSIPVFDNLSKIEIDLLISKMRRACWNANGFGISAIQIGEPFQIFAFLSKVKKDLDWIVEPKVLSTSGSAIFEEGCLSIPGYFWKITRYDKIILEYKDLENNTRVKTFKGIQSRIIQHEIDHLEGLCIPDFLSDKQFEIFYKHFNSGDPVYLYDSPDLDLR